MAPLLILLAAVLGGGVGLIVLARVAQRQSKRLRERGFDEWPAALHKSTNGPVEALVVHFCGPQPKVLERLGQGLAIITIVAVASTIVAIVIAILIANGAFH